MPNNKTDTTDTSDSESENTILASVKKINTEAISKALEKAGLSNEGTRFELMDKLVEYKTTQVKKVNKNTKTVHEPQKEHSSKFSFYDVENSIKKFSGEEKYSVKNGLPILKNNRKC